MPGSFRNLPAQGCGRGRPQQLKGGRAQAWVEAHQSGAPGVLGAGQLAQALVLEAAAPAPAGAQPAVQLEGLGWNGRQANLDLLELAAQAFARQAGLPAAYPARRAPAQLPRAATCTRVPRGGVGPGAAWPQMRCPLAGRPLRGSGGQRARAAHVLPGA